MAGYKLLGHNYTTPDLVAKVTGRAKFAEDYRADGMLFCKLLLSPMPHCRVRRIDTREALAMPGVKAILTADDLPAPKAAGSDAGPSLRPEAALTNEPVYRGEPILAIAAVDEATAAAAIESIVLDLQPLPFVVDPLASLRPGSPNARREGNAFVGGTLKTLKWTAQDFAAAADGALPTGEPGVEWAYGDLDAGFKQADLVLDETFHTQSTSHQPLETRTAMAYWQNGKLYLHCSTQSVVQTVASVAQWVGIPPEQVVVISEYTGGGFGSKIPGTHTVAVPALLAKKCGAPVMMRISREEEHFIGRSRPSLLARVRIGFRKDGRVTAVDMYVLQDAGPYEDQYDLQAAPLMCSLAYQPMAMRFRGLSVLTNTPPPTSQRSPGGMQQNAIMEPVLVKAARQLGIDSVALHRVNAPEGKAPFGGPGKDGKRSYVTSAFVREAIDRGVGLFRWDERKARNRRADRRQGAGHWRLGQPVHRWILDWLRRPDDDSARREAVRAVGCRQPRHALGHRHGARRRRGAGHAVGERRGGLGRHQQEPALDVHIRRQPDHARDLAMQSCGSHGCQAEAPGDRRHGSGRTAGRLSRRGRPRLPPSESIAASHVRTGRAARHRARRPDTTATSCRPTSMRRRERRRRRWRGAG